MLEGFQGEFQQTIHDPCTIVPAWKCPSKNNQNHSHVTYNAKLGTLIFHT